MLVRRGGRNVALLGDDAWEFMSQRRLRRFERTSTHVPAAEAFKPFLDDLKTVHGWGTEDSSARLRERGLANDDSELTIAGAVFLTDPKTSLRLGEPSARTSRAGSLHQGRSASGHLR